MPRATRASAVKSAATKASPVTEPVQLSSPPTTPVPRSARKRKAIKEEADDDAEQSVKVAKPPKGTKRAKKASIKNEENDEVVVKEGDKTTSSTKKKGQSTRDTSKSTPVKKEEVDDLAKAALTSSATPKKKGKTNAYGLTPGQSPYPNWPHPTSEECYEVNRLLTSLHGKIEAPKTIPTPSLTVSGCGEVPSVLDALIRTRLSAATSNVNSSRAFAGLVSKFGVLKDGVGKGSVDWNAVRLADTKDIFEAIKSGGLADVKSKDIKKILQMVWEENQARRDELQDSKGSKANNQTTSSDPNTEINKANADIISLDHLHSLPSDDAFSALTKYPGIGPKTASCVLLFCLQRPSFAVDTHVFRLCKWLGWVPPPGDPAGLAPSAKKGAVFSGPTRNSTYAHCDVRVPDELKYSLHYLFVKHGKVCPRCRAITGEGSEGWKEGCVIDHLVKRSGGRKGGDWSEEEEGGSPMKEVKAAKAKKTPNGKARSKVRGVKKEESFESEAQSSGGSDAESSDLSDLVSDAEIESSEEEDQSAEE